MDPLDQFKSNVRVLTVDHQRMVTREGRIEAGNAAGMIQQLREEIVDGTGMRTGTSSGGAFTPVNLAAVAILDGITKDLKRALKPWGVVPMADEHEAAIRAWVSIITDVDHHHAPAAVITDRWIKTIKDLFEPVKVIPIIGDCPKCGCDAEDNCSINDDGGFVNVPPLSRVGDRASCAMCDWAWNGVQELTDLSNALDLMSEAVPRNMQG